MPALPQLGVTLLALAITLVLLWLVLQRVARLEKRFEGLARTDDLRPLGELRPLVEAAASETRLRPLEEGVRRLGDAVARNGPPLEPKDLVPLQERLELLAHAIDELRHHVD